MKKTWIYVFCLVALISPSAKIKATETVAPGTLIKASTPAIYYYALDGKRYVFPNEKTYKTWYSDFSGVTSVSDSFLASVMIGGNVTYKPGVKMVKIDTDPKVYAVSKGGILRWVKTEDMAIALYGTDWNKKIDDVADAFFVNYNVGSEIVSASDFNPASEQSAVVTIDANKLISVPITPETPIVQEPVYKWNIGTANNDIYNHKTLSLSPFDAGFLTSWTDDRNGQNEIYYQKLTNDGLKDGEIVRVTSNITDSDHGKGVYDGTNLFFMWEDSSPLKRAIYLQRYEDATGNKLGSTVFASSTYATSENPDFIWNESLESYGVTWWDTKNSLNGSVGDIYFSLLTKGAQKSGNELIVTPNIILNAQPQIITSGNNFAVTWYDGSAIKFALINSSGALVGDLKTVYLTATTVLPRIAWSGTGFGIVWSENNGNNKDVYFMLLDQNGNPIGSKKIITSGTGDSVEPDILWSGKEYYIAYADYKPNFSANSIISAIYLTKVTESGTLGETKNISNSSAKAYSPRLAKNGNYVSAAWIEDDGTNNKILFAVETKQ